LPVQHEQEGLSYGKDDGKDSDDVRLEDVEKA